MEEAKQVERKTVIIMVVADQHRALKKHVIDKERSMQDYVSQALEEKMKRDGIVW